MTRDQKKVLESIKPGEEVTLLNVASRVRTINTGKIAKAINGLQADGYLEATGTSTWKRR